MRGRAPPCFSRTRTIKKSLFRRWHCRPLPVQGPLDVGGELLEPRLHRLLLLLEGLYPELQALHLLGEGSDDLRLLLLHHHRADIHEDLGILGDVLQLLLGAVRLPDGHLVLGLLGRHGLELLLELLEHGELVLDLGWNILHESDSSLSGTHPCPLYILDFLDFLSGGDTVLIIYPGGHRWRGPDRCPCGDSRGKRQG